MINAHVSPDMSKPIKMSLLLVKTQMSLVIRPVLSNFAVVNLETLEICKQVHVISYIIYDCTVDHFIIALFRIE